MSNQPAAVPLTALNTEQQHDVRRALVALETAHSPLRAADYPALVDPALRGTVALCVAHAGRTLIQGPDGTYTTGFADDVALTLAHDQIGTLAPEERAVLALVLLHSVAIPRANGTNKGTCWTDGEPVSKDQLYRSQISNERIDDCVTRLRTKGLLGWAGTRGMKPGHQLDRLTPAQAERLWEDLVILAAPASVDADAIRRRRVRSQPVPVPA